MQAVGVRKRSSEVIKRWFVPLLLAVLLASGCARKQILDETGLATVIGYDQAKKGQIRGTMVVPVINPEAQEKIQVISAINITAKGIRARGNLQMDKRLLSGQLRVAIYSNRLAKQGVINIADTLNRDPSIGSRLYLAVYEGETYELLTYPFKEEGNIGMYLYKLIDQNVKGEEIPSPTIHEFFRAYYSQGTDPILPYIFRTGDEVRIRGAALFHKDKYKGFVDAREAFFIKLVRDQFRTGSYEASLPRKKLGIPAQADDRSKRFVHIVFDTISSNSKVRLVQVNPLVFDVKIKLRARILEVSDQINLGDSKMLQKIQNALSEEMVERIEKLIAKLQKWGVDPIGFGEIYGAQHRGGRTDSHEEWHRKYKAAKFRIKVKAEIIRSGVTE